jgi:hypothetical protein
MPAVAATTFFNFGKFFSVIKFYRAHSSPKERGYHSKYEINVA